MTRTLTTLALLALLSCSFGDKKPSPLDPKPGELYLDCKPPISACEKVANDACPYGADIIRTVNRSKQYSSEAAISPEMNESYESPGPVVESMTPQTIRAYRLFYRCQPKGTIDQD